MIALVLSQLPRKQGSLRTIFAHIERDFGSMLNWKVEAYVAARSRPRDARIHAASASRPPPPPWPRRRSRDARSMPVWKTSVRKALISNPRFVRVDEERNIFGFR